MKLIQNVYKSKIPRVRKFKDPYFQNDFIYFEKVSQHSFDTM